MISYWRTQVYVDSYSNMRMWYPSARNQMQDIELIQNNAIRFINMLKGRTDSVSEVRNQLQLQSLEEKRKNHRLCFLTTWILQNEDQRYTLSTSYDEIARNRQLVTVSTRAAAKGGPISISIKKSIFHPSFLPWTIREIQQNAVTIVYPDPKTVKTTGFPIDRSCCESSTSTEVNGGKQKTTDYY